MSQAKKITKKSTQVAGDDLVQQIFLDFESFEGDATDAKALGEEAWDLIIKLRIAQLGKEKATAAEKKQIAKDTKRTALNWDADDASLSTTQKLFNRLAAGRYADAIKLAESSVNEKTKTAKKIMQSSGKNGGEKKNEKTTEIIKKAIEYYKTNQSKWVGWGRKKAAAHELADKFPPIKFSTYQKHLKSLP